MAKLTPDSGRVNQLRFGYQKSQVKCHGHQQGDTLLDCYASHTLKCMPSFLHIGDPMWDQYCNWVILLDVKIASLRHSTDMCCVRP